MHKLLLMVTDAFMLECGTLPHCYFDLLGGYVGSGINSQWKINNLKNELSSIEFEIRYYNSCFCLVAHTKNVFINASTRPLPEDGVIKLNDNDLISLFNYKIRAKVFTNEVEVVTLQDELSYLVNKPTDKLMLNLEVHRDKAHLVNVRSDDNDLLVQKANEINLDPLLALKVDEEDMNVEVVNDTSERIRVADYKFFNPNIESGLECYAPTEFSTLSYEFQPDTDNLVVENKVLSRGGISSPRKIEMKKDTVLDPLFFIK
ncbi:hypothetical protein [Rodentibacter myodis]|uniref:Uncharacterized protein n=1 Tax=Rodentibacter myodis TaxID=1907939 RepID=A0A1V3JG83_9PAST|nr:hypothetical protein [Rodentibacter myodis]OOF55437.1 hypothetical protein BKL49_11570 [Rodentibacter myodis]